MKWVLIIAISNWMIAGKIDSIEFDSKEDCFEALSHVVGRGDSFAAYCKPMGDGQ